MGRGIVLCGDHDTFAVGLDQADILFDRVDIVGLAGVLGQETSRIEHVRSIAQPLRPARAKVRAKIMVIFLIAILYHSPHLYAGRGIKRVCARRQRKKIRIVAL